MLRKTNALFIAATLFTGNAFSQSADNVFKKVASTLENLSAIQYDSYREIANKQDNYFAQNTGTSYFEYDPGKEGKLSRFQMHSDKTLQVYNGTEYYSLYLNDKTYEGGKRAVSTLSSISLLYNSITTLRVSLPLIANDPSITKSVKDTTVDGKKLRLLKFELRNKTIEFPKGFYSFTAEVTRYYDLMVDRATDLPYMIIDRNSIMKDQYYTKTIFTNINTKPTPPSEQTWFISDYKDYSLKKEEERNPMINNGTAVPGWTLAVLNEKTTDSLRSSSLKGKKTVMEFWIKNCGYCMLAFPEMKELQKKFGNEVNIVSINSYEDRKDAKFFFDREKPGYTMLHGGEKLANQIGIYSYPSVVVTDEKGNVIYSARGFSRKEIEAVLSK
jgi:thiol-disulfide isomerase/thioredoxin